MYALYQTFCFDIVTYPSNCGNLYFYVKLSIGDKM